MPINGFLYPGAKFVKPYIVANSCRFNSASADSLTRSTSGAGTSNTTFTISLWIKKSSNDSAARRLLEFYNNSSYYISLRFRDDHSNRLDFYSESNGSAVNLRTTRSFRDPSSWYHIVMRVDTTQSTADDRLRMYVNGVQETDFAARTNPSSSENLQFNGSGDNQLISQSGSDTANNRRFNGYMAEVCFIDGQSLDPTSFGEFDSDSPTIWKPIDVSGLTFGNNGFYLDFEDSSALGNDVSGNNNDFTANNLAAIDQSTDTCTNNFATINALDGASAGTFSEGNLTLTGSTNPKATIGFTQGKWYFECKLTTQSGSQVIGVASENMSSGTTLGSDANGWGYVIEDNSLYGANGKSYHNNSLSSVLQTFANNDILGVAVDMDNQALYFSVNGTFVSSGNPASGASKTGAVFTNLPTSGFVFPCFRSTSSGVVNANFGSPAFSISSGNADANGHGNFEYSVPSGYFALCTKNLAEFG